MNTRLTTRLEIKSLSNMQFEGHGAIFGNVDRGGDMILPGAFKKTLSEHKASGKLPPMFWMHETTLIPGKWLEVSEDDNGLLVKGELAPTELGKEIHTLLKMDAVSGLSIGYRPVERDFEDGVRFLKEVELLEVSIVAVPMNPKAQIAHVKSRLSARGEYVPTDKELAELKRDAERYLRTQGFSKAMAVQCAANLFKDFDYGAILESETDRRGEPVDQSKPRATPAELEVAAGISDFRSRQLSYDLENRLKRIFG